MILYIYSLLLTVHKLTEKMSIEILRKQTSIVSHIVIHNALPTL